MQDLDPSRRTALKTLGFGIFATAGPGIITHADLLAKNEDIDLSDVYIAHLDPQTDVETNAWGVALFQHRAGEIVFVLAVARLEHTMMAHIHENEALGAIAVWLHDFNTQAERLVDGSFTGALNAGVITDEVITEGRAPEAASTTVNELRAKIDASETYVNVHTEAYSGGEIAGQIEPFDWGHLS